MVGLEQVLVRNVGEEGEAKILIGQCARSAGNEVKGPSDGEIGIIVSDAALCDGIVEVVAPVGEDGMVIEAEEAVGESARDEELAAVLAG